MANERPPPSDTQPARRRPGAALLSGAANNSTHPESVEEQRKSDLPTKTAAAPKLPTTVPTKESPPQPNRRGPQPNQSKPLCAESNPQKKMTKAKWLLTFPRWKRLNKLPKHIPEADLVPSREWKDANALAKRNSLARSVRSMQLLTSTSEPSPSPPTNGRVRKCVLAYRTRRYLNQLEWNRVLRREKKLRTQKLAHVKMAPSSADSSVAKGTSEDLNNLGLKYQREERRRSLPSAHSLPIKNKLPGRTKRKLWRRQLDSSSSDSPVSESRASATPLCARSMSFRSPGTKTCPSSDSFTSLKATSSTSTKSALAKTPAILDQYDSSPVVSEAPSRSKSTVQQLRLPSTPHTKKKSKSSTRRTSTPKCNGRATTSIDSSFYGNCQKNTSNLIPKVSSSRHVTSQTPSTKHFLHKFHKPNDPHKKKKDSKQGCKPTPNSPPDTAASVQAHPQAQFKTPPLRTSMQEKPPASSAVSRTFTPKPVENLSDSSALSRQYTQKQSHLIWPVLDISDRERQLSGAVSRTPSSLRLNSIQAAVQESQHLNSPSPCSHLTPLELSSHSPFLSQDVCHLFECMSHSLVQDRDENHSQSLTEEAPSGRENSEQAAESDGEKAVMDKSEKN